MKNTIAFPRDEITASDVADTDELGNPLQVGAYRGIQVAVYVYALVGGATITPAIEAYVPALGVWQQVLAGAMIAAAGSVVLTVLPEITPVANLRASQAIEDRFRVTLTYGAGTSATLAVAVSMVP